MNTEIRVSTESLTLEKKILPSLLPGPEVKPNTFRSRDLSPVSAVLSAILEAMNNTVNNTKLLLCIFGY